MAFRSNNADFAIVADSEVSSVLSHFSTEMAFDAMDNILQNKFRPYAPAIANIVGSYEQNFKIAMAQYPNFNREFGEQRNELYNGIIQKLCNYHNLQYIEQPGADPYMIAFHLYQFLVSDFAKNIVFFFSAYIDREKNGIFDMLNMAEMRKNKDSSTLYSKKIYKGNSSKLSVIHANLGVVLDNIRSFDVTFEDIVNIVTNKAVAKFITSSVQDTGDFYRNFYVPFIEQYKAESITNIRLGLQPIPVNGGIENYLA